MNHLKCARFCGSDIVGTVAPALKWLKSGRRKELLF